MKNFSLIMVIVLMSLFAACGNGEEIDNSTPDTVTEDLPAENDVTVEPDPDELDDEEPPVVIVYAEPNPIRVFENGNANVRLFPDGTFIANMFNFKRVTGTYTELGEEDESVILFSYNGVTLREGSSVSFFEPTGLMQLFGEINGEILTIPEEWDPEEDIPRVEFEYRAYPLIFANETGQSVSLNADSSFTANLIDDIVLIGYHAMRSNMVVLVPGSPSANSNGVIAGTFLDVRLRTRVEEIAPEVEGEAPVTVEFTTMDIPELWAEISGGGVFRLQ